MRLRGEEGARDILKGVDKRGSEVLCAREQPVIGCLCAPTPSRTHVAVFPAPECVARWHVSMWFWFGVVVLGRGSGLRLGVRGGG